MKKILITLLLVFSMFISTSIDTYWSNCEYDVDSWNVSIWEALDKCLADAKLVSWENVAVEWGFWTQIWLWTNNIALYLWIFAVWSIVFWAFMLTISWGEEEKIKKSKDIVKWGILWFLWVVTASAIINLIVKIIYSI